MDNNEVHISHPGKVLFPNAGIAKRDLASYYKRIAGYMLPHIQNRPLTLRRFTAGIDEEGFFTKHAPDHFPDFIRRIDVPMHSKPGEAVTMVMADEVNDLVYFAGQDVIEIHMSLSKSDALEMPDQIIFDLDPSDEDFEKVRKVALVLKELLDGRNVYSFLKTTGSRGVHIHVPLRPDKKFSKVKAVAKRMAELLHNKLPDLTTLEHRKEDRGDKVFIDYLRNEYGMTAIAPYSLRALGKASVSMPIDWHELRDRSLGPQRYNLSNVFRRMGQKSDPWKDFDKKRIPLDRLNFS